MYNCILSCEKGWIGLDLWNFVIIIFKKKALDMLYTNLHCIHGWP